MIICPNCKTENDEDAKFCKNCGYYFLEENSNNQDNNKKEHKKKDKVKHKTKTKNKTKIKKEKAKAPKYKQSNDKPRSSIFTKILLLFFILLFLICNINAEFRFILTHGFDSMLRFSQFFVSPLVKAEAMDREILAVDSGMCFFLSV